MARGTGDAGGGRVSLTAVHAVASFVLPISNPANLVVYGNQMPPPLAWLPRYALGSAGSILATSTVLRWTQAEALRKAVSRDVAVPALSPGGRAAAVGLGCAAVLLWRRRVRDGRSVGRRCRRACWRWPWCWHARARALGRCWGAYRGACCADGGADRGRCGAEPVGDGLARSCCGWLHFVGKGFE